jgi:1-deoxy-D-xylulose-5-phosphate synthase
MWDLVVLGVVPGLRLAAPRDAATLRAELREASDWRDGPTVLRFPKSPVNADLPAVRSVGGVDVLSESGPQPAVDVLLVSVGAMAADALGAAELIRGTGRSVRVVDPRWVQPVPDELVGLARGAALVVTVEDGVASGGVGARVSQLLRAADLDVPTREIGLPAQFLDHGKLAEVRAAAGLDAEGIAERVLGWCDTVLPSPALDDAPIRLRPAAG